MTLTHPRLCCALLATIGQTTAKDHLPAPLPWKGASEALITKSDESMDHTVGTYVLLEPSLRILGASQQELQKAIDTSKVMCSLPGPRECSRTIRN
jgi:hypothetical protein